MEGERIQVKKEEFTVSVCEIPLFGAVVLSEIFSKL